jgi:hypothetical protein
MFFEEICGVLVLVKIIAKTLFGHRCKDNSSKKAMK